MVKNDKESDASSSIDFSEMDDKDDPNFFRRDKKFYNLPKSVQLAIENSLKRAKHSNFYFKLQDLNDKISLYRKLFDSKIPSYQLAYMARKLEERQVKQKKDREGFEKELLRMKIENRKLAKWSSSINVLENMGMKNTLVEGNKSNESLE